MAQDFKRTDRADQINRASQARATGRLGEAEHIARGILDSNPKDAEALLILGMVQAQRNDFNLAAGTFKRVIALEPASFEAAFWLSIVLRRQGRAPEALAMARLAVNQNGMHEQALSQLGMCHMDLGQGEAAISCFQRAIEIAPGVAPLFDNLARALQSVGRNREAIAAYRRVLEIGPARPGPLLRLGDAYMMEPEPAEAANCARTVLRLDPNSAAGHLLLARSLIADGQVAEGATYARKAIALAPGNAVPVAYFGRALQSLGQISEADEQFKRSIELEPSQGFAYHALVHNHKVTEAERPLVDKMAALVQDKRLPRREIIQLEYGLGKALEDLGDYAAAMSHFDVANRIDHELKVGVAPFKREQLANTAAFLIDTFDSEFIERHKPSGSDSQVPVFVVGMMRSGTTLAEQILSSHPDVGGAGELLFWPENAGSSERVFAQTSADGPALDLARLSRLTSDYLQLLARLAPGALRVVDKMNTNYLLLGLLHMAFPYARIVHMRRHPVDTCISIWATPVAKDVDLCGEKENLVFAYCEYLRIMEHWRSVLPADRFLDVQYEDLVADQERVTRTMIEFCGMPWDDACLKPQDNIRTVKTPSVWQVRQPVYTTSTQRWRKYESCLGAFAELFARDER